MANLAFLLISLLFFFFSIIDKPKGDPVETYKIRKI